VDGIIRIVYFVANVQDVPLLVQHQPLQVLREPPRALDSPYWGASAAVRQYSCPAARQYSCQVVSCEAGQLSDSQAVQYSCQAARPYSQAARKYSCQAARQYSCQAARQYGFLSENGQPMSILVIGCHKLCDEIKKSGNFHLTNQWQSIRVICCHNHENIAGKSFNIWQQIVHFFNLICTSFNPEFVS